MGWQTNLLGEKKAVLDTRSASVRKFFAVNFRFRVLILMLLWTMPGALIGCCCKNVQSYGGPVPVPVKSERLELSFPLNVEQAVSSIACLVRTGSPLYDCGDPSTPICDFKRSQKDVSDEYRPILAKLNGFMFDSPNNFNYTLRTLIGEEATETLNIADARRCCSCREWAPEGACGAFRYKELWFLIKRKDSSQGPIQGMEVFLAGMPCREEISNVKSR